MGDALHRGTDGAQQAQSIRYMVASHIFAAMATNRQLGKMLVACVKPHAAGLLWQVWQ